MRSSVCFNGGHTGKSLRNNLFNCSIRQLSSNTANSIKILIIKPDNGFEETNLIKNLAGELEKLGVNNPSIKVEHVESFNRTAIGKTYLIKALK